VSKQAPVDPVPHLRAVAEALRQSVSPNERSRRSWYDDEDSAIGQVFAALAVPAYVGSRGYRT